MGAFLVESVYITLLPENLCAEESALLLRVGTALDDEVTSTYGIAVSQSATTENDEILVTVTTATTETSLIG